MESRVVDRVRGLAVLLREVVDSRASTVFSTTRENGDVPFAARASGRHCNGAITTVLRATGLGSVDLTWRMLEWPAASGDGEQTVQLSTEPQLYAAGAPVILGQFAVAGSNQFQAGLGIEHCV